MATIRKRYSAEFQTESGDRASEVRENSLSIVGELGVHPMVLSEWKRLFMERGSQIFERGRKSSEGGEEAKERAILFEQIGRRRWRFEWLKKKIVDLPLNERKELVDIQDALFLATRTVSDAWD